MKPTTAHLDDAGRMAVEGGVGDLLHQLGVGGRQVLLDLPQDPLFVLGKRHRSHFRSRVSGIRVLPTIVAHRLSDTQRVGRLGPSLGRLCAATGADGTGTETGPHLVDRPLQRRLPAGLRAGFRPGRPSPGFSASEGSVNSVLVLRCARRPAPCPNGPPAPCPNGHRLRARAAFGLQAGAGLVAHELLGRDAEQPDAGGDVELAQSSSRATRRRSAARSVGSGSVRDRVTVVKSPKRTFSCTVRRGHPRGTQSRRHPVGQADDPVVERGVVVEVGREGLLVADRLHLLIGHHRSLVAVPGQRVQVPTRRRCRGRGPACPRGCAASSPTVCTPSAASLRSVAGPTPHRRRAGSGWRNSSSVPGSTTSRPSGLARSLASLASSLVVATPDRDGEAGVGAHLLADGGRERWPGTVQAPAHAGDVEERLVQRDGLDQGRVRPQDRASRRC